MGIEISSFGVAPNHESTASKIQLFRCTNRNGLVLQLTNYGAIVVSMETPDRDGQLANVTLGFSRLAGYLQRHPYFGATVGRYGNRIAQGQFTLDGVEYQLATNDPPHHLHGGTRGFDMAVWSAEPIDTHGQVGVRFQHTSPDGDEGFPGSLHAEAIYTLDDDDQLRMEFLGVTDKATHINLTNHCYWNLSGAGSGDVLEQRLQIAAEQCVAVDDGLIPTGETPAVADTPLDFRVEKALGRDIAQIEADPQGYDHCFVLSGSLNAEGVRSAARAFDPASGRVMEVLTNQPGLQLYTGNFLNGAKDCGGFAQHSAFCLEAQHYPDSPNRPEFPSTVLLPEQQYRHLTIHRFSTAAK